MKRSLLDITQKISRKPGKAVLTPKDLTNATHFIFEAKGWRFVSILREIVEILFAKGMIKMLFCTTSVAIGLNLPIRTAIFTDVNKHDGDNLTILQGHEYVQAGGRAGRLGLDKVGHVIHLNNLFRNVDLTSYKKMMNGKPQTLTSKFKISFNLLLNLIDIGDNNFINFANKSMIKGDIDSQSNEVYKNI